MKLILKILLILSVFIVLALPANLAKAQEPQQVIPGGKLVLGGVYNLEAGQTLDGDLLVLGGNANLAAGSTVNGDVAMLGGNLNVDGRITGSLISLAGMVVLSETSVIEGDLATLGGGLQGEALAEVGGQVTSDTSPSFPLALPGDLRIPVPNIDVRFNPVWDFLWLLVQSFLWAALAVLIALFAPQATRRIGATVVSQPLVTAGLGLLTVVIAPMIIVLLTVTIIGIPVAFLGVVALVLAWAFGVISFGIEIGERLARSARSDWALPLSAALGVFALTLITNIIGKIPCIGWLAPFAVGVIALGAVLLTRFGSRSYPAEVVNH